MTPRGSGRIFAGYAATGGAADIRLAGNLREVSTNAGLPVRRGAFRPSRTDPGFRGQVQ